MIWFRVLLFRDDGVWIAQALEHDINAQGASVWLAQLELAKVLAARKIIAALEGTDPFDPPAAPSSCFDDWYDAGAGLQWWFDAPDFRFQCRTLEDVP